MQRQDCNKFYNEVTLERCYLHPNSNPDVPGEKNFCDESTTTCAVRTNMRNVRNKSATLTVHANVLSLQKLPHVTALKLFVRVNIFRATLRRDRLLKGFEGSRGFFRVAQGAGPDVDFSKD